LIRHAVVGAVGDAAEGQRVAAQRHCAAGHAGQRTNALAATAGDVQRAGTGQIHRAGGRQAASGTDGQRAVVDGGAAGIGVGTGQGHRGCAVLHQTTGTADDAVQGQPIAAEQGEVVAGREVDGVAEGDCQAAVQRRVGPHVQRPRTQRAVVADHQAATVQGQTTTEQVGAAQGEDTHADLDQRTGAGNRTVEGAAVGAAEDQRVGAEADQGAGHARQ